MLKFCFKYINLEHLTFQNKPIFFFCNVRYVMFSLKTNKQKKPQEQLLIPRLGLLTWEPYNKKAIYLN